MPREAWRAAALQISIIVGGFAGVNGFPQRARLPARREIKTDSPDFAEISRRKFRNPASHPSQSLTAQPEVIAYGYAFTTGAVSAGKIFWPRSSKVMISLASRP